MPAIQTPKSVPELLKLIAKHGKRSLLVSGADTSPEKAATGKIVIDLAGVEPLHEIELKKDKVTIGTGMNLGRLVREASGANGLLQQAASIVAGLPPLRSGPSWRRRLIAQRAALAGAEKSPGDGRRGSRAIMSTAECSALRACRAHFGNAPDLD